MFLWLLAVVLILPAGCVPPETPTPEVGGGLAEPTPAPTTDISATPLPLRPQYAPGELVDYTVQTGDTLPAVAVRLTSTWKLIMCGLI